MKNYQQQSSAPVHGFAQTRKANIFSNPFAPGNFSIWIHIGLVVCLLVKLMGTEVLLQASASDTFLGHWLGYGLGCMLYYGTVIFSIPLWLAAWFYSPASQGFRVQFDVSRLLPVLLFAVYALVQLLAGNAEWTIATRENVWSMAPIILLAIPLCSRRGCHQVWVGIALAGLLYIVVLMASGQLVPLLRGRDFINLSGQEVTDRVSLVGNTITTALIMYQCVLAILCWLLAKVRGKVYWIIGTPCCVALASIAILTGSKGPAVAFIVALVMLLATRRRKRFLYGVAITVMTLSMYWVARSLLVNYDGSSEHISIGFRDYGRLDFYASVIKSVPTYFGNGVGSWGAMMGMAGEGGSYVHNSFLEVYYELGLFGVVLYLWAIGAVGLSLHRQARKQHDPLVGFILVCLVFGLMISMFSGSIFCDNELWLGLVLGCTKFIKPVSTYLPHIQTGTIN
jgi:hypothetical protein